VSCPMLPGCLSFGRSSSGCHVADRDVAAGCQKEWGGRAYLSWHCGVVVVGSGWLLRVVATIGDGDDAAM
jgi:hypothetical protein